VTILSIPMTLGANVRHRNESTFWHTPRHKTMVCPECLGKGGSHDYRGEYYECDTCEIHWRKWMGDDTSGRVTLSMLGIGNPRRPHSHKGKPNRRYWKREYLNTVSNFQRWSFAGMDLDKDARTDARKATQSLRKRYKNATETQA